MKILEGVRVIDLSEADGLDLEAYILNCDEGVVLVDTGMRPSDLDKIGAELKDLGKTWKDIVLVFITHKHGDHINNLSKIKELADPEVLAGEGDVKDIEAAAGVRIDRGVRHGDYFDFCGGIEVIHIPGHSLGNISLYLQRHKAIIAGDTIFGDKEGNIYPPPEMYCLDLETAEREIKRLLFYDFDKLLLSHGKNLLTGAKSKVRMLCEEVALRY